MFSSVFSFCKFSQYNRQKNPISSHTSLLCFCIFKECSCPWAADQLFLTFPLSCEEYAILFSFLHGLRRGRRNYWCRTFMFAFIVYFLILSCLFSLLIMIGLASSTNGGHGYSSLNSSTQKLLRNDPGRLDWLLTRECYRICQLKRSSHIVGSYLNLVTVFLEEFIQFSFQVGLIAWLIEK